MQILKGNAERPELLTVKPRDIRKKIFDRKVNAQDREMNVVSMKDIVRVLEGPFKVIPHSFIRGFYCQSCKLVSQSNLFTKSNICVLTNFFF